MDLGNDNKPRLRIPRRGRLTGTLGNRVRFGWVESQSSTARLKKTQHRGETAAEVGLTLNFELRYVTI